MRRDFPRRKRLILDSNLQYRMIKRLALTVAVAVFVFSGLFALYYWVSYMSGDNLFKEYVVVYKQVQTVRTVKVDGQPIQQRYYETEAQPSTTRLQLILPAILINNVLILVALVLMGVWYSHKFAGPVYRIKAVISKSLSGERDLRIYLRDKDELKDLAERVNALLERLDALHHTN
jgi:methyl-accepting chemotaxis protein